MSSVLFALQLITAGIPSQALPQGWKFAHEQRACIVEGAASSQGTYFSLVRYDDPAKGYMLVLSNPSWASVNGRPVDVRVAFKRLLNVDKLPERSSVVLTAVGSELAARTATTYSLAIGLPKVGIDRLLDQVGPRQRIGFFREDTMLTDWLYVPQGVRDRLEGCADPFRQ